MSVMILRIREKALRGLELIATMIKRNAHFEDMGADYLAFGHFLNLKQKGSKNWRDKSTKYK